MIKKQVVIFGGSSDIGQGIIKKLAKEGYDIIATYNKTPITKELFLECESNSSKLETYKLDLANRNEIELFFNKVIFGNKLIENFVYCAGVSKPEKLIMDESFDDIDEILDVNLRGALYSSKLMMKHFLNVERGSVVFISSVYGLYGGACESVYTATKGGLIALTKSLALELANINVRVNCVAPGCIETKMTKYILDSERANIENSIPLKRIGQTEDVANAVNFLISEESSYMTGEVLTVSGGALRF